MEDQDSSQEVGLPIGQIAAGAGVWAGFEGSKFLKNNKFAKANPSLIRDMTGARNRFHRGRIAESYMAANKNIMQSAASRASFARTAESSYMKVAAGRLLGRAAMAANVGLFVAPALIGMTYHGVRAIRKRGYELETPNMGQGFSVNTIQATDRQRGLNAMHNSEFNGRSMMGREAFLFHQ